MDIKEFLKESRPGAYLQIFTKEDDGESGELQKIDWESETLFLLSDEDDTQKVITFDQIDTLSILNKEYQKSPEELLEEEIKAIPLGKYLMIWGNFGEAINQTIKQGKLKTVDWDKRTLVLTSTTYANTEHTVKFDQISSIDTSRSGSGALGSAQTPDLRNVGGTWYRGNTEVGSEGYEDKKRAGTL